MLEETDKTGLYVEFCDEKFFTNGKKCIIISLRS